MKNVYFGEPRAAEDCIPLAVAAGLCGDPYNDKRFKGVNAGSMDKLVEYCRNNLRISSLEQADLAVYPHSYKVKSADEARPFVEAVRKRGLPLLLFRHRDATHSIDPGWGRLYSWSMDTRDRLEREYAMPAFAHDVIQSYPTLSEYRSRPEKPLVGFCGHTGTWNACIKERFSDSFPFRNFRHQVLRTMERTPDVKTRFIRRTRFYGTSARRYLSEAERTTVREEYICNLFDTDYNLAIRGNGNFSFRFYETLSAGRIPVFVNTRCVLPFEDEIDWKRHCVWVEKEEVSRIGEILINFHENLGDESFRTLMRDNRKLWEDYLEPAAFCRRVIDRACGTDRAEASIAKMANAERQQI